MASMEALGTQTGESVAPHTHEEAVEAHTQEELLKSVVDAVLPGTARHRFAALRTCYVVERAWWMAWRRFCAVHRMRADPSGLSSDSELDSEGGAMKTPFASMEDEEASCIDSEADPLVAAAGYSLGDALDSRPPYHPVLWGREKVHVEQDELPEHPGPLTYRTLVNEQGQLHSHLLASQYVALSSDAHDMLQSWYGGAGFEVPVAFLDGRAIPNLQPIRLQVMCTSRPAFWVEVHPHHRWEEVSKLLHEVYCTSGKLLALEECEPWSLSTLGLEDCPTFQQRVMALACAWYFTPQGLSALPRELLLHIIPYVWEDYNYVDSLRCAFEVISKRIVSKTLKVPRVVVESEPTSSVQVETLSQKAKNQLFDVLHSLSFSLESIVPICAVMQKLLLCGDPNTIARLWKAGFVDQVFKWVEANISHSLPITSQLAESLSVCSLAMRWPAHLPMSLASSIRQNAVGLLSSLEGSELLPSRAVVASHVCDILSIDAQLAITGDDCREFLEVALRLFQQCVRAPDSSARPEARGGGWDGALFHIAHLVRTATTRVVGKGGGSMRRVPGLSDEDMAAFLMRLVPLMRHPLSAVAYEGLACVAECTENVSSGAMRMLCRGGVLEGSIAAVRPLTCTRALEHRLDACSRAALRFLGNVVTCDDEVTQFALDHGLLGILSPLTLSEQGFLCKEALWVLSNVAAGTSAQAGAVVQHDSMMAAVVHKLERGMPPQRLEALWVLGNLSESVQPAKFAALQRVGLLPALARAIAADLRQLDSESGTRGKGAESSSASHSMVRAFALYSQILDSFSSRLFAHTHAAEDVVDLQPFLDALPAHLLSTPSPTSGDPIQRIRTASAVSLATMREDLIQKVRMLSDRANAL
eukprot:TRINITY_DN4369_c0_g1_i1.p1 TRINITY_DN4369_c0_g1~~TRINITY_DN4369_c0_g1_i1.p1  ORF type:complete len:871 (-),score=151.94 TRINITY_DN4369_c0_g1_i1:799-3411(-)